MSTDSVMRTIKNTELVEDQTLLGKMVNCLNKVIEPTSKAFVFIAGIIVTAMMLLTFSDVFLRYFFNSPIMGSVEITEFMMALMVTLGLSYCALHKGHIRVDLVLIYIPRKSKESLDILAYGVSSIFCSLITWQMFVTAKRFMDAKLISPILFVPIFPFVFIMFIGMALLVLTFMKDTIEVISEVRKK